MPLTKAGLEDVVAANSAPCGHCFLCERERPELCEDLLFLNGAYAEQITVPARIVEKNLLRVPDHLSFEEAALVEPLACAVHGIEETGVSTGETAAVLGAGPLGLMLIRLAAARGEDPDDRGASRHGHPVGRGVL